MVDESPAFYIGGVDLNQQCLVTKKVLPTMFGCRILLWAFTTVDGSEIRLASWYGKSPLIYRVFYIPGGWPWEFFHPPPPVNHQPSPHSLWALGRSAIRRWASMTGWVTWILMKSWRWRQVTVVWPRKPWWRRARNTGGGGGKKGTRFRRKGCCWRCCFIMGGDVFFELGSWRFRDLLRNYDFLTYCWWNMMKFNVL